MAEQYWIGDFYVDLSRNKITKNKESQTLAPKALAVLTCLAEEQGKVISQDTLLNKVWPDTVVSPNTLQRNIAQLRKALGDDGKVQVYIKTHAKQGYSLESEVRWHDDTVTENSDVSSTESQLEHLSEQPDLQSGQQVVKPTNNDERVTPSLVEEETSTTPITSTPESASQKKHDTNNTTHLSNDGDRNASDGDSDENNTKTTNNSSNASLTKLFVAIGSIILVVAGFQFFTPNQVTQLSIAEIRALTATDNKELAGIYSPDGKFIVFHRYSDVACANNIWAKNIATQEEFQLTENLNSYGSHSFSSDGKTLVFTQSKTCEEPVTQQECHYLMSLDFEKALVSPQTPNVILECKNSKIQRAQWLNNSNIALMQKDSDRWKLISYSTQNNVSEDLYASDKSNVVYFDYSKEEDLIALTSLHDDGLQYIEILKPDGQVLSSNKIIYPPEIPKFKLFYPKFSAFENLLTFSTGRQLFSLTYEGQIANINLPLDEPMGTPYFHPNGKRMLAIKGHYDSDIARITLEATNGQFDNEPTVVKRSNVGEDSAMRQPNGDLIAYKSERSGDEQVWLTGDNNLKQLTNFPLDASIYGMDWAKDGKSILVNLNNELKQVLLTGKEIPIPLPHPVTRLFNWDSENQTVLAMVRIAGVSKLSEVNLATSEIRVINRKEVKWATKTEDGRIVYSDQMNRFWQPGPVEDKLIKVLNGQGTIRQRFVTQNNVVYGVNDEFQLWSYSLDEEAFQIIGDLPKSLDYITDVSQGELLMTLRLSAKKEVAELYLR